MSSEGKSQFELAQDMIKETNRGGWNQSPQQLLSHLQTNGVLTSSLPLAFPLGFLGESISNSEPAVCRFFPRAPSLQMAPASLQWLKQENKKSSVVSTLSVLLHPSPQSMTSKSGYSHGQYGSQIYGRLPPPTPVGFLSHGVLWHFLRRYSGHIYYLRPRSLLLPACPLQSPIYWVLLPTTHSLHLPTWQLE